MIIMICTYVSEISERLSNLKGTMCKRCVTSKLKGKKKENMGLEVLIHDERWRKKKRKPRGMTEADANNQVVKTFGLTFLSH